MYIGIDLGTSFSAVAVMNEEGRPVLVQNSEGDYTTASAILFGEGSALVGKMAVEEASCDPLNFVQFVKRNIGDEGYFFLTTYNEEYNAGQLSSIILKKLVEDTEFILDEKVEGAVITVPAYFDDVRRQATHMAASLTGLNCIGIINEPTAAALTYAYEKGVESGKLLVFDLGGGTFDVTIIEKQGSEVNVLSTAGNRNLGGFDFDNLILGDILKKNNIDIFDDYEAGIELRNKVTQLKKQLSYNNKVNIRFKFNGKSCAYSLNREHFNTMLGAYLSTMELIVEQVLDDSRLSWNDIDHFIMVGGSSRIPVILERMQEISGKRPDVSLNPDHAIAQGAAIQASVISSDHSRLKEQLKINDVNSHSLGLVAVDSNNERINNIIIPRNTTIPSTSSRVFKTVVRHQEKILVELTEGESDELKYVNILGKAEITLPKGVEADTRIRMDMTLDSDQIVHMYAFIDATGEKLGEIHVERKIDMDEETFKKKSTDIRAIAIQSSESRTQASTSQAASQSGSKPSTDNSTEDEVAGGKAPGRDNGVIHDKSTEQFEEETGYPFSLLSDFVGMKPLKMQLNKICHQMDYQQKRKVYQGIDKNIITGMNFMFTGNPGTGKTSAARVIGKILHHYGLLERDEVVETDRSGLVAEYIGHTEKKTMEVVQKAMGGVLFIDEAYTLFKEGNERDFGIQAIECILKVMEDHRGSICFIFAGYKNEMSQFLNANPGLRDRINYTIDFPDYTNEELCVIARQIARKDYALGMGDAAEKALIKRIEMKRVDETFGNARVVRNLIAEAYAEKSYRVSKGRFVIEENMEFMPEDFGVRSDAEEGSGFDDAINKLMGIIGQGNLKEEIKRKVTFAKVDSIRQSKLGRKSSMNHHMVFTGSPGTGKTTFARVIGELYKSIEILKRGEFIETKASDFISQNVGGTREKTMKLLGRSLGNVLFIDEAYSLKNGGEDAIDEILKFMEDNGGNFILILAGYTNEINGLLDMNPGLRSRINTYIEFEDYTGEELLQIFRMFASKDGMILADGTEMPLKQIIARMLENKDENFGNARDIRNLYEKIKQYQAVRFEEMKLGIDNINVIEPEDVYCVLT